MSDYLDVNDAKACEDAGLRGTAERVREAIAIIAAARQWKAAREACRATDSADDLDKFDDALFAFRAAEAALLALLGTPEGT